jgi:hypothetical protein
MVLIEDELYRQTRYNCTMKDGTWRRLQAVYLLALVALILMILGLLGQNRITGADVITVFIVEIIILVFGAFVAKSR